MLRESKPWGIEGFHSAKERSNKRSQWFFGLEVLSLPPSFRPVSLYEKRGFAGAQDLELNDVDFP